MAHSARLPRRTGTIRPDIGQWRSEIGAYMCFNVMNRQEEMSACSRSCRLVSASKSPLEHVNQLARLQLTTGTLPSNHSQAL